jgi:transcriptional regulator with XRE-family HTH domain
MVGFRDTIVCMDDSRAEVRAVAAQIRAELAAAGLTVTAAVKLTGIPRPTIDRYLKGERDIPLAKLMTIARALDIDAHVILRRASERMDHGYR